MIEPHRRVLDSLDGRNVGQRRAAQQDDREAEHARRCHLAVRRSAAAILGDNKVDRMGGQQCPIGGFGEWSTTGYVECVRHRERRIDRLDAAYEIMMLRRPREGCDFGLAEREEDTARLFADRLYRGCGIGNLNPTVAGARRPWRPAEREQRDARRCRRLGRVRRDDCGVRMRGIDEHVDAFGCEILAKALRATESADPYRHGMRGGCRGAAGERDRYRHIVAFGQTLRQAPRLRRAAENEDASHVVR